MQQRASPLAAKFNGSQPRLGKLKMTPVTPHNVEPTTLTGQKQHPVCVFISFYARTTNLSLIGVVSTPQDRQLCNREHPRLGESRTTPVTPRNVEPTTLTGQERHPVCVCVHQFLCQDYRFS